MHTDHGSGTASDVRSRLSRRPRRGGRFAAAGVALCVVLASLGALAGYWWSTRGGDEVRTAAALVLLRPLEGNAFNPDGAGSDLVNMETEAQLVRSSVVTGLAAEELGEPDQAAELRSGVTSTVPPNTQLVRITATGSDDAEAAERAQVLSETFLAFRGERAESDLATRAEQVREEISGLEERRDGIVRRLSGAESGTANALVREERVNEITIQLGEYRVQLAELQAASADPGQVVTDAAAESPSLLGSTAVYTALGALVGLLLGLVLVGGRRRLDERVHGPQDLVDAGVPVLGRLPLSAGERLRALGGLRAAILAAVPARPLIVGVAVGSAADLDDGLDTTSDLTGELGLSLRRAGLVVGVLDLAARPGASAGATGSSRVSLDSEPLMPLSVLLDADRDPTALMARRRAAGLPLAVVNDLGPDDLADRASSSEMRALLAALRGVTDAVVADLGSLDEASSQSLVGAVDAVVLTVREKAATFGELKSSLQRTPTWGGRVAGLVCVAADEERGRGRRRSGVSRGSGAASDSDPDDDPEDDPAPSPEDEEARRGRDGGSAVTPVSALAPEAPR